MTNYKERLDEVLSKTPCSQCDGSGAYADYDGEPVQCQFCWQLRFAFIDKTKQALTSLIKELVAEAKPKRKTLAELNGGWRADIAQGFNESLDAYEQNLLKALEEV